MVVTVRSVIQESPGTGSSRHEATFNERRAAPFCVGMAEAITSVPLNKMPGDAGSASVSFLSFPIFSEYCWYFGI